MSLRVRTYERSERLIVLDTDTRLLYDIIQEAGEIDAKTLHSRYEVRAQDLLAQSTRRKYLSRLGEYNLIDTKGSGKGQRYLSN